MSKKMGLQFVLHLKQSPSVYVARQHVNSNVLSWYNRMSKNANVNVG